MSDKDITFYRTELKVLKRLVPEEVFFNSVVSMIANLNEENDKNKSEIDALESRICELENEE